MCSQTNPLFYMVQCRKPMDPGALVIDEATPAPRPANLRRRTGAMTSRQIEISNSVAFTIGRTWFFSRRISTMP